MIFSLISFFSLIYSVIIQTRSFLKISASIYAVYGFIAMSVAIYGIFLFPKAYTLFAIQSFFVVSMALWFRSQFIVVMNTLLFVVLLVFYINDPVSYNSANFSFMLVAFITARVINWKKEPLKPENRNASKYLSAVRICNDTYCFLSCCTGIACYNFMDYRRACFSSCFGYLLNNIKYRWLAIAAVIASAVNLLVVDTSKMDTGVRILIFLLLAVISIAVSVLYTRHLRKKQD